MMELNYFDVIELLGELKSLKSRIAELEAERRWVPVSERLPEANTPVLTISKDNNVATPIDVALRKRIAKLEGKIDQLTAHSDIERQDEMSVSEHANYLLNEYGRLQFDYAAYCKPDGESLRNEARNNLEEYIAELEAAQRWIPVSERLPEANTPVLTISKDNNVATPIDVALRKRIAKLEGKIDQLTAHSDIERQDDKSSNETQTQTIVYGKDVSRSVK